MWRSAERRAATHRDRKTDDRSDSLQDGSGRWRIIPEPRGGRVSEGLERQEGQVSRTGRWGDRVSKRRERRTSASCRALDATKLARRCNSYAGPAVARILAAEAQGSS